MQYSVSVTRMQWHPHHSASLPDLYTFNLLFQFNLVGGQVTSAFWGSATVSNTGKNQRRGLSHKCDKCHKFAVIRVVLRPSTLVPVLTYFEGCNVQIWSKSV